MAMKKMKFFFKKFLDFEEKHGDESSVAAVKQKAQEYVDSHWYWLQGWSYGSDCVQWITFIFYIDEADELLCEPIYMDYRSGEKAF